MPRIKIKHKTKEKEGIDTRSFKLGYQTGFREAEQVTIDRLDREYYKPLREENEKLRKTLEENDRERERLTQLLQEKTLTNRPMTKQLNKSVELFNATQNKKKLTERHLARISIDLAKTIDTSVMAMMKGTGVISTIDLPRTITPSDFLCIEENLNKAIKEDHEKN